MLHFKCVPCRLRVEGPAVTADHLSYPCPGCGSPLERVGALTEIVGFQAIGAATPAEPGSQRWLDADGGFSREAVAVALASLGVTPGNRQ
jgi:hypothetical protein